MTIDVENNDNHLKLILNGRLDSMTAEDLEKAIENNLSDETKDLMIDMKGVDFISSKGLRVLVAAYRKMNGRPMCLSEPNSSVKEVLRLSGLLKVFTIE